jgi:RNA polymerase sigma-70 factor, ECF subfamily
MTAAIKVGRTLLALIGCCGNDRVVGAGSYCWQVVVKRRSVVRVEVLGGGDALLVERIRAGDDQALAAVYDQHAGLVYGLARRVVRDEQLAREVTQEVFTYLWEMPHRVDLSRGSLRTYLALLAHRRAVDEVRRHEARFRAEAASAAPEREDGPEAQVVESAARTWRTKHLAALLDMLPAEQRAAIQLAYYDGLTYVQVAKALGIPEGTAKWRLRAALARLRTLLTDEAREAIS